MAKGKVIKGNKIILSLCMAIFLSLSCLSKAYAAPTQDGDFGLVTSLVNPKLFLNFAYNYTTDGSDRNSMIPYVFKGNTQFTMQAYRVSGYDWVKYISGYATQKVTFTLSSQTTGLSATQAPRVSIVGTSLPDGVTVSIANLSGNGSLFSFDVRYTFDKYEFPNSGRVGGGFNIQFEQNGYAGASDYGSSYMYMLYNATVSNDYSGLMYFGESLSDFSAESSFYHSSLNSIGTRLSMLYDRIGNASTAGTVIYNIIESSNRITNELLTSHQNDNANTNSILNELATQGNKTRNDLAFYNQKQIDNNNQNSKNEIDSADKNANDIMHSYDSGSQEDKNKEFDSSQKELQEVEGTLFSSAADAFGGLNLNDYSFSKFTAMANAFTFVSGFMQSLYIKGGDFALIVTIGLVVMIASKVIGLYRFSTGGDK